MKFSVKERKKKTTKNAIIQEFFFIYAWLPPPLLFVLRVDENTLLILKTNNPKRKKNKQVCMKWEFEIQVIQSKVQRHARAHMCVWERERERKKEKERVNACKSHKIYMQIHGTRNKQTRTVNKLKKINE